MKTSLILLVFLGVFLGNSQALAAVVATDNFNRANSTGLGANWSSVSAVQPDIVSNEASSNADPHGAVYTAVTWPDDQYAQGKITGTLTTNATDGAGVGVRMSAGADNAYWYHVGGAGSELLKTIAGVGTVLSSGAGGTTGDTIYIEVQGSNIIAKKNGATTLTATDSDRASGGAGIFGSGNPDTVTLDDWEGGDFSAKQEQEGFRWRADDGDEASASWLANQDTDITRDINQNTRLRMLVNASSSDPAATQYQLEFKNSTESTWDKIIAAGNRSIQALDSSVEHDTTNGSNNAAIQLDSTHYFNIWQGAGGDGFAQVFELNSTTGTTTELGTPFEFDVADYQTGAVHLVSYNAGRALVTWGGSGADGYAHTLDFSTSTWAISTSTARIEFDTTNGTHNALEQIDSTHFLVTYQGAQGDGFAQVLALDSAGTVTEPAAATEFDTGDYSFGSLFQVNNDSTRYILFHQGVSGDGFVRILTVDTSTWAVTATSVSEHDAENGTHNAAVPLDGTHFLNFYGGGASATGKAEVFAVDTSTWAVTSPGSIFDFNGVSTYSSSALLDTNEVAHVWSDVAGRGKLETLRIDASWNIASTSDVLISDSASSTFNALVDVNSSRVINFWAGSGVDGFVQAFDVAKPQIGLSLSSHISAAAASSTTAQLTAPSGKTTASSTAGRISDDTNPLPAINIVNNGYTELEWSLIATSTATTSDIYDFRVTKNGTAFDYYTVIPHWTIGTPAAASGMRVAGSVYSDEGTVSATSVVSIAVNGGDKVSTTTDSGGNFAFDNVASTTGAAITVWLDNGGGIVGAAVTLANAADITGLHIYKDRLVTRHENSGPIANSDILKCAKNAGSQCADSDLHFSSSSGTLIIDNDVRLYLWPGDTFTPGANVTLSTGGTAVSMGGDLKWASSTSVLSMGSNTLTVGGDWINDAGGTFSKSANQTTTMTATTTGFTMSGNMIGSNAFERLEFNGNQSASAWTIQDPILMNSTSTTSLTVRNGLVTVGNGSGDFLQAMGGVKIANTANESSTLQTASVNNTGNIYLYLNATTSIPSCPSCVISVGASSGSGQGSLKLAKNTILQLNPRSSATASDAGVEVESTGYFQVLGAQDATSTVSSITEDTSSSTITVSGTPFTSLNLINDTVRITNTSSLAFGRVYDVSATSSNTIRISATRSAQDVNPDVTGGTACTGNAECSIDVLSTLESTNRGHIGRYLHNITESKYYLIVGTTDGGVASDTILIVNNEPDDFTIMHDGDDVEITDGIAANDIFEVLDYAHVTAENGTACSATINQSGEAYVWAKSGSETLIRYADVCNLGRNAANVYGMVVDTVDGSVASQGFTVDDARIHHGYRGIYGVNVSNNNDANSSKGVRSSAVYNHSHHGIMLEPGTSNTLTLNQAYLNTEDGMLIDSTSLFNVASYNHSYKNSGNGLSIHTNSVATRISSNWLYGNTAIGVNEISSNNNLVIANKIFANQGGSGIQLDAGENTVIVGNQFYLNSNSGVDTNASPNNVFVANRLYAHPTSGILLRNPSSVDNIFFANINYNNSSAITIQDATGITDTIVVSDDYGSLGSNTQDIEFSAGGVSNLTLHNTILASASEAAGIDVAGSYLASFKNDSLATSTKLWGHYALPSDDAETPQNESLIRFNYANNLWEKSASHHGYAGTGSEDANLDYDLVSSSLSAGPYAYRLVNTTAGNCGGVAQFAVYRYASSGAETSVGTASCGTQFTDTNGNVNVKFKVDGGGTAYVLGDTYTFVVWDAANNTSSQKYVELQQTNDRITVPSGTTFEVKGGGSGTNQFTNVSLATGGANTWDFLDNGGTTTVEEVKVSNFQMASGTLIAFNTQFLGSGFPKVATGTLNVDWYFSLHAVDSSASSTNIDTAANDVTVYEVSGSSTVYKMASGSWGSGVASTTTGTGSDGHIPQPTTDGAIRFREYSRTPSATTTYRYNVTIAAQNNYSSYNYFSDYGSNYLNSASSTLTSGVDKVIGNNWYRDTIGTENAHPGALNDPPTLGTVLAGMSPSASITFTIDSASVSLGALGLSNSYTATGTTVLGVTSTASNGFNITAYETDLMSRVGGGGTVANWTGTNALPTVWSTTCTALSTQCGFGYRTSDADLTQFATSTLYAGFTTSTPGDVVSTATSTVGAELTTITYRMSVDTRTPAGSYQTVIRYILTPIF